MAKCHEKEYTCKHNFWPIFKVPFQPTLRSSTFHSTLSTHVSFYEVKKILVRSTNNIVPPCTFLQDYNFSTSFVFVQRYNSSQGVQWYSEITCWLPSLNEAWIAPNARRAIVVRSLRNEARWTTSDVSLASDRYEQCDIVRSLRTSTVGASIVLGT